jgi:hypothetical protein
VRYAPFNSHTSFFLGSCHSLPGSHLLVSLRYEVPIECLKVDCIPRRLTRRLISTLHIQLRDDGERRSQTLAAVIGEQRICNRLRSGSSCSAIFLTETLRLRTTCGHMKKLHEVHLAGVSLPTVRTVFRLALARAGTCVVSMCFSRQVLG